MRLVFLVACTQNLSFRYSLYHTVGTNTENNFEGVLKKCKMLINNMFYCIIFIILYSIYLYILFASLIENFEILNFQKVELI
jgi:hypothetical protein